MRAIVVHADVSHAAIVAEAVREKAALGSPTKDKLQQKLAEEIEQSLYCFTGFVGNELACIYGLRASSLLSEEAYLWLITTDAVDRYPFTFVRHSQIVIQDLKNMFPKITGVVEADYKRSIKWLRWLGAKIGPAKDIHGFRLRHFTIGGD